MTAEDREGKLAYKLIQVIPKMTYLVFFDRHVFDFLCVLNVNTINAEAPRCQKQKQKQK